MFVHVTEPRERAHFDAVSQRVMSETVLEETAGSPSVRLDSFIGELARKLDGEGPNLRVLLQRFRDVVPHRIDCSACSKDHVCNGQTDLDSDKAREGLCLAQLRTLFLCAKQLTDGIYKASRSFRELPKKPQLVFSTAWTPARPHSLKEVTYALSGQTLHHVTDREATSEITLVLQTRALDWRTYMACLYVLIHELVCHAYEGCAGGVVNHCEPHDPFAEGWMDFLAAELMRKWLNRAPSALATAEIPEFASDRHDHGQELHCARTRYMVGEPGSATRKRGKMAAANFLGVLDRMLGPGLGWGPFVAFSTELNVISSPTPERDRLVEKLCLLLPEPGKTYCPLDGLKIQKAIGEYLGDQDVAKLCTAILDPR